MQKFVGFYSLIKFCIHETPSCHITLIKSEHCAEITWRIISPQSFLFVLPFFDLPPLPWTPSFQWIWEVGVTIIFMYVAYISEFSLQTKSILTREIKIECVLWYSEEKSPAKVKRSFRRKRFWIRFANELEMKILLDVNL